MKALDNIKTDDLTSEQKQLLSELIKSEMLKEIENAVSTNTVQFSDAIKNYLKSNEEE